MGRSPSRDRRRERGGGGGVDRRRKRSRSPQRERDRSETRKRRRDRDRSRERSRSPARRSRSRSEERPNYDAPGSSRTLRSATAAAGGERPVVTDADLAGKTVEEAEMMKTMGFCGFDSTKNKKVDGNAQGEVHVILKRKYRQYMNRKGGFNRPLDFVA